MRSFLKPSFLSLVPYQPGEQPQNMGEYIKLNTNESPFPPSETVLNAVNADELEKLRLYSDPTCIRLIDAIAQRYGVSSKNVAVGNGSDELLAFIFQGFFDESHEVCYPDISYGFYPVFCNYADIKQNPVPLNADFTINLEAFIHTEKSVVLANPNAPTGIALSRADIRRILEANPDRLVVVDEAYVDFGAESSVSLVAKYENLIVVQTFSKSRSLAGARLGFCIAHESLIADINRIRFAFNPYNVNRLTLRIGERAMADEAYFQQCVDEIIAVRTYADNELRKRGFTLTDSKANFLFAKHPNIGGRTLYEELKKRKILVRHFERDRIRDFVRITVGSKPQIDRLLAAIDDILQGEHNENS